jgi:hypothetical protein
LQTLAKADCAAAAALKLMNIVVNDGRAANGTMGKEGR